MTSRPRKPLGRRSSSAHATLTRLLALAPPIAASSTASAGRTATAVAAIAAASDAKSPSHPQISTTLYVTKPWPMAPTEPQPLTKPMSLRSLPFLRR